MGKASKEYHREYRLKNKKKITEKMKEWREEKMKDPAFREKLNQQTKLRRKNNPEKFKQLDKAKYLRYKQKPENIFQKRFYGIMYRCHDKRSKDYSHYGLRGIVVEWKNFESFKKDMYKDFLSFYKKNNVYPQIDRINPNGNYSKDNTRWCSASENSSYNKITNKYITYKGKTMIIADWARALSVSRQAVRYRLAMGWTPKQIIETPFSHSNKLRNGVVVNYGKNN